MKKKVTILGKVLPIWLIAVLLIASGAGAAVGTVLQGNVIGEMPVTVSQAVLVGTPGAVEDGDDIEDDDDWVDGMTQPVDWLDGDADDAVNSITAPDRSIGAVRDDHTAFQFAAEVDQGDIYFFYVPVKNASDEALVAELTLNFPECIEIEVMDGHADTPDDDNVANMTRTSFNTWKFDLDSDAEMVDPDDDGDDAGDVIVIVVQADDTCVPGYYNLTGKIQQISF